MEEVAPPSAPAPPSSPSPSPSPSPAVSPSPEPFSPLVRTLLIVAAAALLWLSLPPVGLAPLALVAAFPFLVALQGLAPRAALGAGFAYGALSSAACAWWFVRVFGDLAVAAPALWLIMGLYPATYAFFHALAARRGRPHLAVLAPLLWISIDWIRSEGWHLRFAWFTLGHALAGDACFRQSADLAGVYGLTLLAFGTSFLLERAVALRASMGRALIVSMFAVALPVAVFGRGAVILGRAPALGARSGPGLRVLAVQDEHPDRLEPKRTLTQNAALNDPPDVIVWPEDSFFQDPLARGEMREGLEATARLARGAFVVGAMKKIEGEERSSRPWWNAALLLDPSGNKMGEYHKRVPVQFVEGMCRPGEESPVFPVSGVKLGVAICYDGTYPFVLRDIARAGAEVVVVPTMDMKEWGETQHDLHALFYPLRACELRRPIVRAASSGVSLALDAWGRELARVAGSGQGTLVATVEPSSELTPYLQGGFALPFVSLGACALAGIAGIVTSRKN